MRIEYDAEHDLLNIVFLPEAKIEESVEVDGIVIDYAEGPGRRIASIEVLDAGKRTTGSPTSVKSWAWPCLQERRSRAFSLMRWRGKVY